MLHIDSFYKYLFGTFITFIFMINIIYAFNLTNSLGLPFVYQSGVVNYSDKFFGISDIITSFKNFFGNNKQVETFKGVLKFWYDTMNKLDVRNLTQFTEIWSATSGGNTGNGILDFLLGILNILFSIFNLFINVPYILMVIIYFALFFFYVLMLIFIGISYICYLLSGMVYSFMPNTDFGEYYDHTGFQWIIDPETGLPVMVPVSQFFLH